MAAVFVRYTDGTEDCYGTEGGETDALVMELQDDPEVAEVWADYDAKLEG
jgi:hypothetical protein